MKEVIKPGYRRHARRRYGTYLYNNRLKNEYCSRSYYPGVLKIDCPNGKTYYRVCDWGKSAKKYFKRYSNKQVRRYRNDLNRSEYKKVFDLWWTLF